MSLSKGDLSKGLLIIAHGSPRKEANDEFIDVVAHVAARLPVHLVQHAFLDCASPKISEGIDLLADKKVSEMTILPYFLVAGKHTAQDITLIVDKKRHEYPNIQITLTPPIGTSPSMIEIILKIVD